MDDDYKGIVINPYLPNNIKSFLCHCLTIDQDNFNEVALSELERLDFILTIMTRIIYNYIPFNKNTIREYSYISQSFKALINAVFPYYTFDFTEGNISKCIVSTGSNLKVINGADNSFFLFNASDYNKLSELILKANDIKQPPTTIYVPVEIYDETEIAVNNIMVRMNRGNENG